MNKESILSLQSKVAGKSTLEVLRWFLGEYKGKIALGSEHGAGRIRF
jgi:hypothetical protein